MKIFGTEIVSWIRRVFYEVDAKYVLFICRWKVTTISIENEYDPSFMDRSRRQAFALLGY